MKKNLLTVIVTSLVICIHNPSSVYAQKRTTRLYVAGSHTSTVMIENGEKQLLVKDYMNSTRMVNINSKGNVNYMPFGQSETESNTTSTKKQYSGYGRINESDVYNANARYYNAKLGIFIQPDIVEGPNRYAYVGGNPVMHNDPTGNQGSMTTRAFWREVLHTYEVWANQALDVVFGKSPQAAAQVRAVANDYVEQVELGIMTQGKNGPEHNEDAAFCFRCVDGSYAMGVFDGMGGMGHGREAAQIAHQTIGSTLNRSPYVNSVNAIEVLSNAFTLANQRINAANLGGGGTTASVVWMPASGPGVIGHIGDSRVYGLWPGEGLTHLTHDHNAAGKMDGESSFAVQQRLAGATSMQALQGLEHLWTHRNVIDGALSGSSMNPDFYKLTRMPSRIVIASDGVLDPLTDRQILNIVTGGRSPSSIAASLVNTAHQEQGFRAKLDDRSAVVGFFPAVRQQPR